MYQFYLTSYGGTALSEEEFPELCRRAKEKLAYFCRIYRVTGSDRDKNMAVCAMAEVIDYFQAAQNGQGGLRYASVGTVSASGKGVYSQVDISPQAQEKALYRTACMYLDIYRGNGLC